VADEFLSYDTVSYDELINLYNKLENKNKYDICAGMSIFNFLTNETNTYADTDKLTVTYKSAGFIDEMNKLKDVLGLLGGFQEECLYQVSNTLDDERRLSENYAFTENAFGLDRSLFSFEDPYFTHFIPLVNSKGFVPVTCMACFVVGAQADDAIAMRYLKSVANTYYRVYYGYMIEFPPTQKRFDNNTPTCISYNINEHLHGVDYLKLEGQDDAVPLPATNVLETEKPNYDYPMRQKQIDNVLQMMENVAGMAMYWAPFSIYVDYFNDDVCARFAQGQLSAEEIADNLQSIAEDYLKGDE